jgi:hypothetical protein
VQPAFFSYTFWVKLGFDLATPRVIKRKRGDGRLDVVWHNADGSYDLWISLDLGIWYIEQELVKGQRPLNEDELLEMLRQFPVVGASASS